MTSLDELKDEYRELLRDGKTEQATDVAHKIAEKEGRVDNSDDGTVSADTEVVEEDGEDDGIESFTDIDGIGDELAVEFEEEFGSVENLKDAEVEELEPIPGVGEKRGEDILEQVR